jgi:Holliday junction resolvase
VAQPEAKLSRKIMDALRSHGAFCFKVWGSEHMMAGLPDIIGCYQGVFFAFETKMPAKRSNTSRRQEHVMGMIRQAGGISQVVCSAREALLALDQSLV